MKFLFPLVAAATLTAAGAQAATLTAGSTEAAAAGLFADMAAVTVTATDVDVDYLVGDNLSVGDTVSGVTNHTSSIDLTAGTYDSFLIHFDPVGSSGTDTGAFTFAGEIVALIVSNFGVDTLLTASDAVFGSAANVYENNAAADRAKGRRTENGDSLTLTSANTLSYFFTTKGGHIDNVRVITQIAPVPVPASLPLLLAGFGGLAAMRRRNKS